MNKAEAKQLLTKHLLPLIESDGYKERKIRSSDFRFVLKTNMGEDEIIGGFNDYNPIQKIVYSVQKTIKPVNDILLQLQADSIILLPKVTKNTATIGFSYMTLNDIRKDVYLPEMQTEKELQNNVAMMVTFLTETAFPLLERFEDIREIDKVINGEEPWTTDWLKPFSFGLYFELKRLIIARLAGLGSYDRILAFVLQGYEVHLSGKNEKEYATAMNQADALNKLLATIKPLY